MIAHFFAGLITRISEPPSENGIQAADAAWPKTAATGAQHSRPVFYNNQIVKTLPSAATKEERNGVVLSGTRQRRPPRTCQGSPRRCPGCGVLAADHGCAAVPGPVLVISRTRGTRTLTCPVKSRDPAHGIRVCCRVSGCR